MRLLRPSQVSLRWYIFVAVFVSSLTVFLGVATVSSLLYERLMAEQTQFFAIQLDREFPLMALDIEPPSVSAQVRFTYIASFIAISLVFLVFAGWLSHQASRRINRSVANFQAQIEQITNLDDLHRFNQHSYSSGFKELNLVYQNVNRLTRQLEKVLIDKDALEFRNDLLSSLIIRNAHIQHWAEYTLEVLEDIHKKLPFDFCSILFARNHQLELNTIWARPASADLQSLQEAQMSICFDQQIKNHQHPCHDWPLLRLHHSLSSEREALPPEFQPQASNTSLILLDEPRVGGILGLCFHASALTNPQVRLAVDALLIPLINLLGAARVINSYTLKLEQAISQSERENQMAANILYKHLIDKNAQCPAGVSHLIRPSGVFSGDIILTRRSPSGSVFVLIADATGHGLTATITIMPIINIFDSMVSKGHALQSIITEMNSRLVNDLPDDRFVAATLIEIDIRHQEMLLWNGGMPETLLISASGKVEQGFTSQHMALGILDHKQFDATPVRCFLPPQGFLFCFSDGLIEQVNENDQPLGQTRVYELLDQTQPYQLIDSLITAVEDHRQHLPIGDDISFCLVDLAAIKQAPDACQQQENPSNQASSLPPFYWQIRLQGRQLLNHRIATLSHDFLQTLKCDECLKERVFTLVVELTHKTLDKNLLGLPARFETSSAEALDAYHRQKQQALEQLSDDAWIELSLEGRAQTLTLHLAHNGVFPIHLSPISQEKLFSQVDGLEIDPQGQWIQLTLQV